MIAAKECRRISPQDGTSSGRKQFEVADMIREKMVGAGITVTNKPL